MIASRDLSYKSAAELCKLMRKRELSPVELLEASIQRIEARNPSLNALVYYGFEDARKRAQSLEKALIRGENTGPLHGIPTVMKDNFDFYPGWPTTLGGLRAMKDNIADSYCTYAERFDKAGAVMVGKTNSPTMGFRGTCDNFMFGPTRNPFNIVKNSGGSSGGSAAAVADGLVPIAEGADGGGSIRIPAAWCGVYGYKASFGRVPFISRPNAFAGGNIFVFEGTLTRTVEDAAISLNALAGYDSRDPFSLDEEFDFTKVLGRSIKGWKIAYSPNFDVFPVDRQVQKVIQHAVKKFEQLGAHVEEVKIGINKHQRELSNLWSRIMIISSVEIFEHYKKHGIDLVRDHPEDFPPEFLAWLEKGYQLTVTDVIRDQQLKTEIYDAIQNVFGGYDLIVTPTLACLPVDNRTDGNTKGPEEINGEPVDPLIGWCMTYFTNFTGHPSASIPAGLSDNGLPVGLQIIGRRYADADVLAASAAFEQISPWKHTYEICEQRII